MNLADLLARVADEAPFAVFDGRFAYWRGFSGRRYLHTVYDIEALDALSGGVAVLLDADGEVLHVLLIEDGASAFARREGAAAVHVHFAPLGRGEGGGQAACNDLRAALVSRIAAL